LGGGGDSDGFLQVFGKMKEKIKRQFPRKIIQPLAQLSQVNEVHSV